MKVSLVINRFNENLNWVKNYKNLDIFVYNKGKNNLDLILDNITINNRKNLGREAETYFYHIIENYNNLSDLIIFTQAHPFDNIPSFFSHLNEDLNKKNYFKYFHWYGENTKFCDENGGPCIYPILSGHPNEYNRTLKTIYEEVFDKKCPTKIEYKSNASFSVSKDLILNHPKKVYQKFLNYLIYPEQAEYAGIFKYNPYEAHIIERMWRMIFNEI